MFIAGVLFCYCFTIALEHGALAHNHRGLSLDKSSEITRIAFLFTCLRRSTDSAFVSSTCERSSVETQRQVSSSLFGGFCGVVSEVVHCDFLVG